MTWKRKAPASVFSRRLFNLLRSAVSATPAWRQAPTLIAIFVAAAATWLLVEIAQEVGAGTTSDLDRALVMMFRTAGDTRRLVGPAWVQEMMRDFTALGGIGVLTIVTGTVTGYLLLERKRGAAVLLLVATSGGVIVSQVMKLGFARARPDIEPVSTIVLTSSFPSGHSTMAAAVYLTCAVLMASYSERRRVKSYVIVIAAFIAIVVGASRVYLGVHWPTDVLAGLCLGSAWALFCWVGLRLLQVLGWVEPEVTSGTSSAQ